MKRILIVEDDQSLSNGIVLALRDSTLAFLQAPNLDKARHAMASALFDLIILDLNLPDGSGLDFLRELRTSSAVPVVILTANDLETDVVTGLELGADDYIVKPFSLMILRARVKARLRSGSALAPEVLQLGKFEFSFGSLEFFKDGMPVELSKTEQKLLRVLVENRGRTVTRAQLVDAVWTDGSEYVDENALSVTVKRLRDKLEDKPSMPELIKTVYGIGYSWVAK